MTRQGQTGCKVGAQSYGPPWGGRATERHESQLGSVIRGARRDPVPPRSRPISGSGGFSPRPTRLHERGIAGVLVQTEQTPMQPSPRALFFLPTGACELARRAEGVDLQDHLRGRTPEVGIGARGLFVRYPAPELARARSGDLGTARSKEERGAALRGDRAFGPRLEEPRVGGVVGTTLSSRDPVTDPSWTAEIARGIA